MVDWIYTFLSALSDNSMKIMVNVEESYKVTQNETNGRRQQNMAIREVKKFWSMTSESNGSWIKKHEKVET